MKTQEKKKNYSESKMISFAELVEVRKQEMQGVLPGLMSVVNDPLGQKKEAKVYSPKVMQRSLFRIGEFDG